LVSQSVALAQTVSLKDAADSLFQAKDYDRAIRAYEQVLADRSLPSDIRASAQVRIARSQLFKGDSAEARKAYLVLAETFPDQPGLCSESLLHAGSLAAQAKDYESAIAHYTQAVERYAKSTEYARLRAAEAQTRLGSVYLARRVGGKREIGKAVAAFEKVEKIFPDQKEWVAEAKMQLVALKLEYAINDKAEYAAAARLADTFIQAYPQDTKRLPTVRLVKAEALFHDGHYPEALKEANAVKDTYPDSGQPAGTAQFLAAQCLERQRDYPAAIAAYRAFLAAPESFSAWEERPGALYFIAMCLRAQGDLGAAAKAVAELQEQYPDSYFAEAATKDVPELVAGGR
jgi:tetratricopeptide (TPR) repeat protein